MKRKAAGISPWAWCVLCIAFAGCVTSATRTRSPIPEGVRLFVEGSFGGTTIDALNHGALPFKLQQAVLIRRAHEQQGLPLSLTSWPAILASYGIPTPSKLIYGDGVELPWNRGPTGVVVESASSWWPPARVEVANLGCTACHSGVTYDTEGQPNPDIVRLGGTSTSFDAERYVMDIYAAISAAVADDDNDQTMALIDQFYPDMGFFERFTLRRGVLPRVRKQIKAIASGIDRPFPFSNGGPGLTNGIAALKFRFGLLDPQQLAPEHGYTSIPDLADRRLRNALLVDAVYAPTDLVPDESQHLARLSAIAAFFTVPTMGVTPQEAPHHIPDVHRALVEVVAPYRPQPFPGSIDTTLAATGQRIYQTACAACHGAYAGNLAPGQLRLQSFPNRLSALTDIGSDPARALSFDNALTDALLHSDYARYQRITPHAGYVAPILTGVWSSAPYLHNGSVPTLWHLLHPESRPVKFLVGGHRLDYRNVGLRGAVDSQGIYRDSDDYQPWSTPALYDTSMPGRANTGHEAQFAALDEAGKSALLEFLKLL